MRKRKKRKGKKKKPFGVYTLTVFKNSESYIVPLVIFHVYFSRLLSGSYEDTFPFMGL